MQQNMGMGNGFALIESNQMRDLKNALLLGGDHGLPLFHGMIKGRG